MSQAGVQKITRSLRLLILPPPVPTLKMVVLPLCTEYITDE